VCGLKGKNSQVPVMYLLNITLSLTQYRRKQNTSTTEIACGSPVPINNANSLKIKTICYSQRAHLKLWLRHFLNIRWNDTWLSLKPIWCSNFHD